MKGEELEKWFRSATEQELRDFLNSQLEPMADSPEKAELLKMFNAECDRRSRAFYEMQNNGEWI